VFPEGIAYDQRTSTVYVTSTTDGTVFRGDARDSVLDVFLAGRTDGRTTAVGIAVDPARQRLFVAGGGTGLAFVYDARTGALLARLAGGTPPTTFVNDVAVTRDGAAYFTDSQSPVIYRVTGDDAGGFRLERWLELAGTAITYQPGFNLNGIEATADGRYLFTVQSNTGRLFRIDTRTRAVVPVDLGGATLTNGDGLLLRGATLYAVRNAQGVIAEVRLSELGGPEPRGRVVGAISDPSFRFPTTVDEARGRLLVVNSQFNRRAPGQSPELPFTVSVVKP
jgi:Cu-Zn family superoxide dismutase